MFDNNLKMTYILDMKNLIKPKLYWISKYLFYIIEIYNK